jgi:hypothetical protein
MQPIFLVLKSVIGEFNTHSGTPATQNRIWFSILLRVGGAHPAVKLNVGSGSNL